ncbi:MAG: HEAT repeat domain-containing protein [Opitutales bacterium]|nr:HEAT repeat domain-containing protein [Opitutales bacterium]
MKLIILACAFPLVACTSLLNGEETKQISSSLVSLEGLEGLLAQPLMVKEAMPRRILGVGISHSGKVYVTDTIRQAKEEISIIQSGFLLEQDMALGSVAEKKRWIEAYYSMKIAKHQGMQDLNDDGKVDLADLKVRSEKIYTLQDRDQDGVYDSKTLFADGFNDVVSGTAHSVLPWNGDVYATVIPDLWMLRDSNGDGRADQRESIAHGFAPHFGYGNHDLHSVIVGYDGKLYWSMGDRGMHVVGKNGEVVSEPDSGTILRSNLDGTDLEIYASGLRNCQYFDFDNYGNIFSVDHDADFQGERERLVYLAEASDSGWRNYYQYRKSNALIRAAREDLYNPWLAELMWKPFHAGQPSHLLPAIENSWNAPASFSFQPGLALGGKYKDHFLVGGLGLIRAFKMVPDGASFTRQQESVLIQGLGAQVLASSFAPDGRLYFVMWNPPEGRSPLWALHNTKQSAAAELTAGKLEGLLAKGFGSETRADLLQHLGADDRRVRQGAQFELVRRNESAALKALLLNRNAKQFQRLHCLWALGQLKLKDREVLQALSADADAELRAQVARWAGDLQFDPDEVLLQLIQDASPRVKMMAAIALGKIKTPKAFDLLVELLVEANNEIPVLRHAGVTGLAGVASIRQLQVFSKHPSEALRIAAVLALRKQHAVQALSDFLNDDSEQVRADAVRAIYDEATPTTFAAHPDVLIAVAKLLSPTHSIPVNIRALAANRRLADLAAVKRIAEFAVSKKIKPLERIEALNTLRFWTESASLDLVDGRHFPVAAGRLAELKAGLGPGLDIAFWDLTRDKDPNVAQKAIAVLSKLAPSDERWQQAVHSVMDAGAHISIRQAWMRWLRQQDGKKFIATGIAALKAESAMLRVTAAEELLAANAITQPVEDYLLHALRHSKDTPELQNAIKMLASLKSRSHIMLDLLKDLQAGTIAPEVRLDVLQAATHSALTNKLLQAPLKTYHAAIEARGPLAKYQLALEGGDPVRGKNVFLNNAQALCSKCHGLKQEDQRVGPSLQGIGKLRSRESLLQSIIDPQAEVVPGYGTATFVMKDGRSITAIIMHESKMGLTLKLPNGNQEKLALTDIKSRSKAQGMMLDLNDVIGVSNIRDLVAYLKDL